MHAAAHARVSAAAPASSLISSRGDDRQQCRRDLVENKPLAVSSGAPLAAGTRSLSLTGTDPSRFKTPGLDLVANPQSCR